MITDADTIGTSRVKGSNYCDMFAKVDERTNRATIVGVIDNLVKGAAGQAIQNMNVQYGFASNDWFKCRTIIYLIFGMGEMEE